MNIQNMPYVDNPTKVLQAAIRELEIFTTDEATSLHVNEEGQLVAEQETLLEKVVSFIMPFFSGQVRQQKEDRLMRLKDAILRVRDTVQSHYALIEHLENGDDHERAWAKYILEIIQRYNSVVTAGEAHNLMKYRVYSHDRQRLLLDKEIHGRQIKIPAKISVKYDSHPYHHSGSSMIQQLGAVFLAKATPKSNISVTTHKGTLQFMSDIFRVKAHQLVKAQLQAQHLTLEVLQQMRHAPIEVEESSQMQEVKMQQLLEIGPGAFIFLSCIFNRHIADSKLTMPSLKQDSFRICLQSTHCGFPYPSQHSGLWALSNHWVDAMPLRGVLLLDQLAEQQKNLVNNLLIKPEFAAKARRKAKIKKEIVDDNLLHFVSLHRKLQHTLMTYCHGNNFKQGESVLDAFYQQVLGSPCACDLLIQTQETIVNCFIRDPFKEIEKEWLTQEHSSLRYGTPLQKIQALCAKLEHNRNTIINTFDQTDSTSAYIVQQGIILGQAFQSIGIQYLSEKMGFAPIMLSDLQRRLQICAFQQLITFLDECNHSLEETDRVKIKKDMEKAFQNDLQILNLTAIDDDSSLSTRIVNDLEEYYMQRFTNSINECVNIR